MMIEMGQLANVQTDYKRVTFRFATGDEWKNLSGTFLAHTLIVLF
jgi:hypothetical protein